ncbi:unnamed protein product [Arctogadus glacialis]
MAERAEGASEPSGGGGEEGQREASPGTASLTSLTPTSGTTALPGPLEVEEDPVQYESSASRTEEARGDDDQGTAMTGESRAGSPAARLGMLG